MEIDLRCGDCLDIMKEIPNNSIDCIICDLPYGTTAHKWDAIIPFESLWSQYNRIIKQNGVIVLFATEPFTSSLIMSNPNLYRYSWIWEKESANGFLNANYAPLKITEDICVFSKAKVGSLSKNPIVFHPPTLVPINKAKRNNPKSNYRKQNGYQSSNNILNSDKEYTQKYTGYPNNILFFARDSVTYHPTQKPIDLLKYLIKTYTNEEDIVLDNCMGSGTTGVACKHLNRKFIGIEKDNEYFEIAKKRIENE